MAAHGVAFGKPTIDLDKLRNWKGSVVKKLTGGLKMLAKQRKVDVVTGYGKFISPNVVEVKSDDGKSERIAFDQCIIAAGSEAIKLPGFPDDPRIIDSTGALELPPNTKRLLVIGGGIIGLEMATVYESLGVKVSVGELTPGLMPGADPDLVKPLEKRLRARYEAIYLGVKVTEGGSAEGRHPRHVRRARGAPEPQVYDPRARRDRPHAQRQGHRRGSGRCHRDGSRLRSRGQAAAHERAAHLRDRRHHRPADAGA